MNAFFRVSRTAWPVSGSSMRGIFTSMACVYALGVLASLIYTRIMATVTQGTLKNFRVDMFTRMQTLPVKYFDTHAHGDIMSTYTNDTDAIRHADRPVACRWCFQSSLTITVMLHHDDLLTVCPMTLVVCLLLRCSC